ADILAGLRQGHAYITFAPNGPSLDMTAGDATVGDSVPFSRVKEIQISANGLLAGDVIQVVTRRGNASILQAKTAGNMQGTYTMEAAGFAYLMILRNFIPGVPPLPALVSNPIYFEAE
ncbi:MAG: hypothetical protein Q8M83_00470, partial [bacterium]|nr:hypothetical protein [bacterium]